MKPTKKEKRMIARRARLLPDMEHANKYDRVRMSGEKLIAANPNEWPKDGSGEPIDPKKVYIVPVHRRVNHFEEMCAAFTRSGMAGVEKYEAYMHETHAKDMEEIRAEAQRKYQEYKDGQPAKDAPAEETNKRLEAAQEHATPKVEQEGGAE
jgi:hypothetical protein